MAPENLLCFYTTERTASVSLIKGGHHAGELQSEIPNKHAEFVTEAALELMSQAGLQASDLNRLLTCHGPGSFTGIRVSVSMAKALSYSEGLPIWSTDSTRLWRFANAPTERSFVCLNAHKNLFFCSQEHSPADGGAGSVDEETIPLQVMPHDHVQRFLSTQYRWPHWITNVPGLLDTAKIPSTCLQQIPKSTDLWNLFRTSPNSGSTFDWKSFAPLYLRNSEAEESNNSSG